MIIALYHHHHCYLVSSVIAHVDSVSTKVSAALAIVQRKILPTNLLPNPVDTHKVSGHTKDRDFPPSLPPRHAIKNDYTIKDRSLSSVAKRSTTRNYIQGSTPGPFRAYRVKFPLRPLRASQIRCDGLDNLDGETNSEPLASLVCKPDGKILIDVRGVCFS